MTDSSQAGTLERAGVLLLNHSAYTAATSIFVRIITITPKHTMAWYGLGNALFRISRQSQDLSLLKISLSCLRRSIAEDATNQMSAELCQLIETRTPLSAEECLTCQPYVSDVGEIVTTVGYSNEVFVLALQQIESWEERLQLVMWLGDQRDPDFADLLVYASEHDSNSDVRMGAVKRLASLGDLPQVRQCLERLVASVNWQGTEPYLSMTLRRIQQPWANKLLAQVTTKK